MEFAFRSHGATKLAADGDKKHWYKKAVAPLIGHDLAYRKKQMFTVPVGEWFCGPMRDLLRDALLSQRSQARGYFDPREVRRILDLHLERQADFAFPLWNLLMLELWHREMVDGSAQPIPASQAAGA